MINEQEVDKKQKCPFRVIVVDDEPLARRLIIASLIAHSRV